MEQDYKKLNLSFIAIDQYKEDYIVKPTEREIKDKSFIAWGDNNNYPEYLYSLYSEVATLKSVIDGLTDYIIGSGVDINSPSLRKVNSSGHSIDEVMRGIAKDLVIYGGFACNVIKSRIGEVVELHYIDFKRVRTDKKTTKVFYSDDWGKSYGRIKFIEYPVYTPEENSLSTILYYKNSINSVYPIPLYSAATEACELEKKINIYHYNLINNNFSGTYIVNLNNGQPSDELKQQIEDEFYEKFTGIENAGRPVLCFNDSKENETTLTKIDTDSFADKYNALAERARQQIFTAFRATPNLFGIPTETTGFSEQEYNEAFKLFNKTVVYPLQTKLITTLERVFGENNITIKKFELEQ